MTIPASVLLKLATLGLSQGHAEAVASMLADVERATKDEAAAAIGARRANDRERKQRQRAGHGKSRDVTGQHVTERDTPPQKEKSPPAPPLEKNTPPQTSSDPDGSPDVLRAERGETAKASRGSRVDGFEPDIAVAVNLGLNPDRARSQADRFLDFWRGQPGQKGVKLDWPATWRNWIRNEIDRNGTGPPVRTAPSNVTPHPSSRGHYDRHSSHRPTIAEQLDAAFERRHGYRAGDH